VFCPTGLDPVVVVSLLVLLGRWSVVFLSFCSLWFMAGRSSPDVLKGSGRVSDRVNGVRSGRVSSFEARSFLISCLLLDTCSMSLSGMGSAFYGRGVSWCSARGQYAPVYLFLFLCA
jgi:hypothetical protein